MAKVVKDVVFRFSIDETAASKDAKDFKKSVKGVNDELDKADKKSGSFVKTLKGVGAAVAASFAIEKIVEFGRANFELALELENVGKKAATVFGDALPQVTKFAEESAASLGLTTNEAIGAATSIGDLLVPLGFTREAAAELSTSFVGLSGALSEWSNGQATAAEVSDILAKAVLGEREQLKTLGISISEADVQARLFEKGQKRLTGAALAQAKALATQELIFEKSADAQAAFATNQDSLARQTAQLNAEFKEIQEQIAQALLPIFRDVVTILNEIIENSDAFTDELDDMFKGIGLVIDVSTTLLGSLRDIGEELGIVEDKTSTVRFVLGLMGKAFSLLPSPIGDAVKLLGQLNKLLSDDTAPIVNTAKKATVEYIDVNKELAKILQEQKDAQQDVNEEAVTYANTLEGLDLKLKSLQDAVKKEDLGSDRFKELQAEIKVTQAEIDKYKEKTDKAADSPLRGSIADLRAELAQYTNELENDVIPGSEEYIRLLGEISDVTIRLNQATRQIEPIVFDDDDLPNLADLSTFDPSDISDLAQRTGERFTDDLGAHFEEAELAQKLIDEEEAQAQLDNLLSGFETFAGQATSALGLIDQFFDQQTEKELSRLEKQKNAEIAAAGDNAAAVEAIEKDFAQKSEQINNERAEKERITSSISAAINTALAITKALATGGIPLAIATGIFGAAQIALINSQQFAEGVIDLQGPGTGTSDSISARLSRGESVMTAKETKRFKPLLQAIRDNRIDPGAANEFVQAMTGGGAFSYHNTVTNAANFSDRNIVGKLTETNALLRQTLVNQGAAGWGRKDRRYG